MKVTAEYDAGNAEKYAETVSCFADMPRQKQTREGIK